jgi:hypothetical protein
MSMEHRWGKRAPIRMIVELECEPHGREPLSGSGCVRDVSVSGAFIETNLPIPPLAAVRMTFQSLTRGRLTRYSIPGFVMRSDAEGIGIEWSELAPVKVVQMLKAQAHVAIEEQAAQVYLTKH